MAQVHVMLEGTGTDILCGGSLSVFEIHTSFMQLELCDSLERAPAPVCVCVVSLVCVCVCVVHKHRNTTGVVQHVKYLHS